MFSSNDSPTAICTELESFLRSLAPIDLPAEKAFYVVSGDVIGHTADGDVLGCVFKSLDLAAIEWIGDRWRGRGPAMAINFERLRKTRLGTIVFTYSVLAVALHEAAHILDSGAKVRPMPNVTAERLLQFNLTVRSVVAEDDAPCPPEVGNEYATHGEDFIRTALHLHHRACQSRKYPLLPFCLNDILHLQAYNLSSQIFDYERALGDEPQRCESLSFAQILTTPPPAEFHNLYIADVLRRATEHPPVIAQETAQ